MSRRRLTSVKIAKNNQRVLAGVGMWSKPYVKSAVKDWLKENGIEPKIQWYNTYMNFSFHKPEHAVIFALVWS